MYLFQECASIDNGQEGIGGFNSRTGKEGGPAGAAVPRIVRTWRPDRTNRTAGRRGPLFNAVNSHFFSSSTRIYPTP